MPLPLIPIAVVVATGGLTAIFVKRSKIAKNIVRKRTAARCLCIFQDYVFYAATNVFLLLAPILMGLIPQVAKYSLDFLAAGYVLVMSRATYSSWSVYSELSNHIKKVEGKRSFSGYVREMLLNIIEDEVRDEINSKTFKGVAEKAPLVRLFSKKLLESSEAAIHTEIMRLVFRMGMAVCVYLGITHFLSAPIMFGAEAMPWWQSCVYPFYHSVELCLAKLWYGSPVAIIVMAAGLLLYSETSSRVAERLRNYDKGLPAMFFVLPILGFVFALFEAAGCHGAHIYTYFLGYLCLSKSFLDAKTAGAAK